MKGEDLTGELATYDELVRIIETLPTLVREKRRRLGLTLRAAEAQSGVGLTTIHRFERQETIAKDGLIALLRWVGTPDPAPDKSDEDTPR